MKQMCGTKAGDIPCITLIDSKDLHEAVHNIKTTQDKRLIGDINSLMFLGTAPSTSQEENRSKVP